MYKMDSSIAVGYYVKNSEDFHKLFMYLNKGNIKFNNWVLGL